MLPYIALLAIFILLLLCSIAISKGELLSPVPLCMLGVVISVFLSVIGRLSWNDIDLSINVAGIIGVGGFALLVGQFAATNGAHFLGGRSNKRTEAVRYGKLYVARYFILYLIIILAVVLRVYETYKIGMELGVAESESYSEISRVVRNTLDAINSPDGMRLGVGYSFIERQLEKVVTAAGFVSAALLGVSLLDRNRRKVFYPSVALMLCCWHAIVVGGRGSILYYLIAVFVAASIQALRKGADQRELAKRILLYGVGVGVLAVAAFYVSSFIVGRAAGSGIIEYISFYFGAGAPSFQMLMNAGGPEQSISGIRTFYYLFSIPYKIGLISSYPMYSLAWFVISGHWSNVFTCFARYYFDFGLAGVFLLPAIGGAILTALYKKSRVNGGMIPVILVAYFSGYAFDMAREDYLFSRFLSPNGLLIVIIMIILAILLTQPKEHLKHPVRCLASLADESK